MFDPPGRRSRPLSTALVTGLLLTAPHAPAGAVGAGSAPACRAGPIQPLTLYHVGHSLTDRMADLLDSMVEAWTGRRVLYAYKSIPGASLYWHWAKEPTRGLKGNLRTGNAWEVLHTGRFDALVLTESTALDSLVGHPERGSERYANLWVDEFLGSTRRPDPRVFVYSTWAGRNEDGPDTPETVAAFLSETERRQALWERIASAIRDQHPGVPVHIIPVGLVLKRLQEQVRDGTLALPGGRTFRQTFFKDNRPGSRGGCGTPDPIHLGQVGIYAAALTHYAVIYRSCPIGLPSSVPYRGYRDGCISADRVDVEPSLARHIQRVVWDVVNAYEWAGMR